MSASIKMRKYSRSKPRKMSAGRVKMTPAAMDWPALPAVWTMMHSRMETLPLSRRKLIEMTAMGMEAATVSPARRPTYTVTAPKKVELVSSVSS